MITIHVLSFGVLCAQLLHVATAFVHDGLFTQFMKLTALVGIIMATVGYMKARNPMVYVKWMLSYVLIIQVVLLPTVSVSVEDMATQKEALVTDVPVIFAVAASLMTAAGVGIAENFDALFMGALEQGLSLPHFLTYTKTGPLFGSKLILAIRDLHIIDWQLKEEINGFFRNCVMGDMRINHSYTANQLTQSQNIWGLISLHPSNIRMTSVNREEVTCLVAAAPEGEYSLRAKLEVQIKEAYSVFGGSVFGASLDAGYENLFETYLSPVFHYFNLMQGTSHDIFLQLMMINAMDEGVLQYQAFTDSAAGVANNHLNLSQTQHVTAFFGQKLLWLLPMMHTLLLFLLLGLFPIVIVMSTLPSGIHLLKKYVHWFASLQCWPLMFAMLNMAMTLYAREQTMHFDGLNLRTIDKLCELHQDIACVTGFVMLMIPFLSKALVSQLSLFSQQHSQEQISLHSMEVALSDDDSVTSFTFGQTSFYQVPTRVIAGEK